MLLLDAMRAIAVLACCLMVGLAAGLAPSDASSEELSGPASAGADPVGAEAAVADAPELEAAAAALAGLLAAGAGDVPPPYVRQRRGRAEPTTIDSNPGGSPDWIMGLGKRDARYTPYISVGVLSNMQQFFDNLRNNLESLESLPKEERDVLLGQTAAASAEQERAFRPRATAAYLHALRNHRPSHKIRNFVAEPEPASLRGSNHYDPNWLWTGLGRRR